MEAEEGLMFENETATYPLVHVGDGAFLHLPTNTPFKCEPAGEGVSLSLGRSTVYTKDQ